MYIRDADARAEGRANRLLGDDRLRAGDLRLRDVTHGARNHLVWSGLMRRGRGGSARGRGLPPSQRDTKGEDDGKENCRATTRLSENATTHTRRPPEGTEWDDCDSQRSSDDTSRYRQPIAMSRQCHQRDDTAAGRLPDRRLTCSQHGLFRRVRPVLRVLTLCVGNRFCSMAVRQRVKPQKAVSPAEQAAVGVLIAADHLQQSFAEICERHGITTDQYRVLRILRDAPPTGYARGEVTSRCSMHRSPDMTRMLDRLVRLGFAKRRLDPDDRRCSVTTVTLAGLAMLARIDPEIAAAARRVTKPPSSSQLHQLARLTEALAGTAA